MQRWPDGSIFVEDPHAAARRLEAETPDFRVWYGDATGHYWAIIRGRTGGRLIEAKTIDALAERIQTSATPPASPAPRGAPVPDQGHGGRGAPRGM